MASEILTKRQAYASLAVGTTASGDTRTARVGIGTLDKDAWDADKAVAILAALQPIFEYSIEEFPMVATYSVME